MSNKAIAWTTIIALVVLFVIIGIGSMFNGGSSSSSSSKITTHYSSKCSWCGKNQRMPNKSVCKDCNELAELMIKYNK